MIKENLIDELKSIFLSMEEYSENSENAGFSDETAEIDSWMDGLRLIINQLEQ